MGESRIHRAGARAASHSGDNNKKPAEENLDGLLAQVKLVAGTGYGTYLTPLVRISLGKVAA